MSFCGGSFELPINWTASLDKLMRFDGFDHFSNYAGIAETAALAFLFLSFLGESIRGRSMRVILRS
jgi:hypothetical protein